MFEYRESLDDYVCVDCGTGHAFTNDVSEEEIKAFLAEHVCGDFRLPPNHPAAEAEATHEQREEARLNG
jgi:hypothetical protein